jgi:hypothetical protein
LHQLLNTLKFLSIFNSKLKLYGRTSTRTGRRALESHKKNQKATVSSQRGKRTRRDRTRPTRCSRRAKVPDYLTGRPTRIYNNKKVSNQSLHRTVNSLPHKIKRRHQSLETTDKRARTSQISRRTLTRWNFKHRMPEIGKAITRITHFLPMLSPQNRRKWPRCSQVACSRASASHPAT